MLTLVPCRFPPQTALAVQFHWHSSPANTVTQPNVHWCFQFHFFHNLHKGHTVHNSKGFDITRRLLYCRTYSKGCDITWRLLYCRPYSKGCDITWRLLYCRPYSKGCDITWRLLYCRPYSKGCDITWRLLYCRPYSKGCDITWRLLYCRPFYLEVQPILQMESPVYLELTDGEWLNTHTHVYITKPKGSVSIFWNTNSKTKRLSWAQWGWFMAGVSMHVCFVLMCVWMCDSKFLYVQRSEFNICELNPLGAKSPVSAHFFLLPHNPGPPGSCQLVDAPYWHPSICK